MSQRKTTVSVDLTAAVFSPASRGYGPKSLSDRMYRMPVSTQYNKQDDAKGYNVPQVYYLENVLPVSYGFSSVAYIQAVPPIAETCNLQFFHIIKDSAATNAGYAYVVDNTEVGNSGDYLLLNSTPYEWVKLSPDFIDITEQENPLVSKAYVVGRQFIHYSNVELRELITNDLETASFVGLNPTAIRGICGVSNYLIAFDDTTVYWSSLENPLDFTPSLTTGAGSITPNSLGGTILSCHPIKDGFLIYTTANVVSAHITNDFYQPFIFAEVSGSSGLVGGTVQVHNNNNSQHVVMTPAGIQILDKQEAKLVYPELSDMLSDRIIEHFDSEADEVVEEFVTDVGLRVAVSSVTSRYLVVSYGRADEQHSFAFLFDSQLGKWGRLGVEHKFCDLWPFPVGYAPATWEGQGTKTWEEMAGDSWDSILGEALFNDVIGRQLVSFIKETGEISLVHIGPNNQNRSGVAIFGYYQPTNDTGMMVTNLELGNAAGTISMPQAAVKLYTSYSGTATDVVTTPTLMRATPRTKHYNSRVSGLRHSICVAGAFDLSYIQFTGMALPARR